MKREELREILRHRKATQEQIQGAVFNVKRKPVIENAIAEDKILKILAWIKAMPWGEQLIQHIKEKE